VKRFGSALILLFVSACTHETSRPSAIGPAPSASENIHGTLRRTPDEQQLATQFQAAAPLATLEGEASYYGDSLAGHSTASGEPYLPRAFTAAHRHLPLGTILRVTRRDGTRSVYVRINDRGPYGSSRRILDLSRAAAEQLGMLRAGVLEVRAEVVAYGKKRGH
jgi:rare lipoprotein A